MEGKNKTILEDAPISTTEFKIEAMVLPVGASPINNLAF